MFKPDTREEEPTTTVLLLGLEVIASSPAEEDKYSPVDNSCRRKYKRTVPSTPPSPVDHLSEPFLFSLQAIILLFSTAGCSFFLVTGKHTNKQINKQTCRKVDNRVFYVFLIRKYTLRERTSCFSKIKFYKTFIITRGCMDVITVLQKPCINKILTTKKQKEIILEKNFEMR